MNPLIQLKTTPPLLITLALLCLALPQRAQAVSPAPDGGYPGGNTAEGQAALLSLTTGGFNTAVGFLSLRSDTTAGFNTAIGAGALLANTADDNTATGAGTLFSNTTGVGNTADGALALFRNTEGNFNTAIGLQALENTTASGNTAIGNGALFGNHRHQQHRHWFSIALPKHHRRLQRCLRFYAGVPLHSSNLPIGSLCILDVKPRRMTEREKRLLEVIAEDVMDEIKRRDSVGPPSVLVA